MFQMKPGRLMYWQIGEDYHIGHEMLDASQKPIQQFYVSEGQAEQHTLLRTYHTRQLVMVPSHLLKLKALLTAESFR